MRDDSGEKAPQAAEGDGVATLDPHLRDVDTGERMELSELDWP